MPCGRFPRWIKTLDDIDVGREMRQLYGRWFFFFYYLPEKFVVKQNKYLLTWLNAPITHAFLPIKKPGKFPATFHKFSFAHWHYTAPTSRYLNNLTIVIIIKLLIPKSVLIRLMKFCLETFLTYYQSYKSEKKCEESSNLSLYEGDVFQ